MRASHAEEVGRLQATVTALRNEVVSLKKELADDAEKLSLHAGVLSARDAAVAESAREVEHLKQQLDAKREDNMRLQKQLSHLVEEVRQSQSDAAVAQRERERKLGPLTAQAEALGHSMAVKQRQVDLMQRDLDAANQRNSSLQADLTSMRNAVEQVQEARHKDQQAFDERAQAYQRRERLLHARCRLLQAWCFRAWWALDAGRDPLQLDQAAAEIRDPEDHQAAGVRGSAASADIVPRRGLPLPADWRAVLRFQATLFHWLAAETIRGKSLQNRDRLLPGQEAHSGASVNTGDSFVDINSR